MKIHLGMQWFSRNTALVRASWLLLYLFATIFASIATWGISADYFVTFYHPLHRCGSPPHVYWIAAAKGTAIPIAFLPCTVMLCRRLRPISNRIATITTFGPIVLTIFFLSLITVWHTIDCITALNAASHVFLFMNSLSLWGLVLSPLALILSAITVSNLTLLEEKLFW